jgi:hypothetical protein
LLSFTGAATAVLATNANAQKAEDVETSNLDTFMLNLLQQLIYGLIYLFCPGGAEPAGLVFTIGTPFATPFGVFPPPLVCVGVIAPATTLSICTLLSFTGAAIAVLAANATAQKAAEVEKNNCDIFMEILLVVDCWDYVPNSGNK